MNAFDSYISNPEPAISTAATLLESTTQQHQSGALTDAEYTELCNDILDYNRVVSMISDMTRKQEIYEAFMALSSIVGAIKSL